MVRCWSRIASILLGLCSVNAFAVTVVLEHDAPVYGRPEFSIEPVRTVRAGQSVTSTEPAKNGYRHVRLSDGRSGWMDEEDFILKAKRSTDTANGILWGVGIDFATLSQGKKKFQTQDQLNYQTSGYSGRSTGIQLAIETPIANRWRFAGYLAYESISFTGHATEVGVPVAAKNVQLDESAAALGLGLHYDYYRHFWVGGELEYARVLAQNLKLAGLKVPTFGEDVPNYVRVSLVAGANVRLAPRFFMIPQIKAGAIPLAKPSITSFGAAVALGYLF